MRDKKEYTMRHPLGKLTIKELKKKALEEGILVYGDKTQILQCFDQSKAIRKIK